MQAWAGHKVLTTRNKIIVIGAALVIGTAVAYQALPLCNFIDYDDQVYVYENSSVKAGITLRGLCWAFTNNWAANWHPLTWVSHMLDCQMFGLNPFGHHLMNLFLHIVNTILLFTFLNRTTGAVWKSGAVAALFAWHPLHVESVAWISERKDVLSTLFVFLTLLSYHRYTQHPDEGLSQTILFFVLGLLSKPMVVTLPFLLLLLDYWPLSRSRAELSLWRQLFEWGFEKKSMFLLSFAAGIATIFAQRSGGAVISLEQLPFELRLQNTVIAYIIYIRKMFWPSDLAIPYPRPTSWPWIEWLGCGSLILLLSIGSIIMTRRCPYLIVGWLWYLTALLPVIGLIQVGSQLMADRYTYLPLVGIFVCAVWGVGDLLGEIPQFWSRTFIIASIAILGISLRLTYVQSAYWRTSTELFSHAVQVTRDNAVAHMLLGGVLHSEGREEEALFHYKIADSILPDHTWALFGMGQVLARLGRTNEAIRYYRATTKHHPYNRNVYWEFGLLLAHRGDHEQAAHQFFEVLRLEPSFRPARVELANSLNKLGRPDLARIQYSRLKDEPTIDNPGKQKPPSQLR